MKMIKHQTKNVLIAVTALQLVILISIMKAAFMLSQQISFLHKKMFTTIEIHGSVVTNNSTEKMNGNKLTKNITRAPSICKFLNHSVGVS